MQHSASLRTAIATAVRDAIDAGTGPGKIRIFSATPTLLAEITLSDPCGTIAGPTLTFSDTPLTDTEADAPGTAASADVCDSDDTTVLTLTVGVPESGADLELATLTIATGQPVQISSASYTAPV